MTERAALDLGDLGLERGGHLLVKRALAGLPVGGVLALHGRADALAAQLRAFCRAQGHEVVWERKAAEQADAEQAAAEQADAEQAAAERADAEQAAAERADAEQADAERAAAERAGPAASPWIADVVRSGKEMGRFRGAERAGGASPSSPGAICASPPASWGLAARGALVEAGTPAFDFSLADKHAVWSDEVPRLYAQAAAAQWDPATAIPWGAPFNLPDEVEDAVVQVMTYLVENETAALLVPARFLSRLHPHFREVMQLLAVQIADEARHIEVFTRRATLRRTELGLSTVGGQASLKTLVDEPDYALASFLLSVLGEGSFLSLLRFLHGNAPDPVTREVARLTGQDEARHVAFGLAHLAEHVRHDPSLSGRLARAVEERHAVLQHTSGLNEEVFDALVLLAAGSWDHEALARGHDAVVGLRLDMDDGRQRRLKRLGFSAEEAAALSSLHTRNFM